MHGLKSHATEEGGYPGGCRGYLLGRVAGTTSGGKSRLAGCLTGSGWVLSGEPLSGRMPGAEVGEDVGAVVVLGRSVTDSLTGCSTRAVVASAEALGRLSPWRTTRPTMVVMACWSWG